MATRLFSDWHLTAMEEQALRRQVENAESIAPGTPLVLEGALLERPKLLLAGWAASIRLLRDSRRQILRLMLPGDLLGLSLRPGGRAPAATIALTSAAIAELPLGTDELRFQIAGGRPMTGFAGAALRSVALDEALAVGQLVRVGQLTAYERTAHLMLELFERLAAAGQVYGDSFVLPLTQEILADTLGLSIVHTNRVLQQLRREKLIEIQGTKVSLLNKERMAEISDWQPLGRDV